MRKSIVMDFGLWFIIYDDLLSEKQKLSVTLSKDQESLANDHLKKRLLAVHNVIFIAINIYLPT